MCRKVKGFPTGLTKFMAVTIDNETSVDDVKNALVNYGSIATTIKAMPSLTNYVDVMYPPNAAAVAKGEDVPQAVGRCQYREPGMDHAVTVVGWNPCTVS